MQTNVFAASWLPHAHKAARLDISSCW